MRLILLLLLISSVQAVMINEVMYDPGQCADTDCEWVELYNNLNATVANCTFQGKSVGSTFLPGDYLVLVRDAAAFGEHFGVAPTEELTFTLPNTGADLVLAGNCSDSFDYSTTLVAGGNNYTLERREDGTWARSLHKGGSPGAPNSIAHTSVDYSLLSISEVLPDPVGADDALKPDGEWVELFYAGDVPLDLRGLQIRDAVDAHEVYLADSSLLQSSVLEPGGYVVVYRNGDSDFALNNHDFEEVRLFSDVVLDEMSYQSSVEGMSWSFVNDSWYLTQPTPGAPNLYVSECQWSLEVEVDDTITSDRLNFTLTAKREYGAAENITVRGHVADVFGRVIREYRPWTNSSVTSQVTKMYSPPLPEGTYQVKFWYEDFACTTQPVNRLIALNPAYSQDASSLAIETVYIGSDDRVTWGDQITVKTLIYKGNETRHAVELWAEQEGKAVSLRTKFNVYDQYRNHTLTLPVQFRPNCNQRFRDGSVDLVLEGFGLEYRYPVEVRGISNELCSEYLDYLEDFTVPRFQTQVHALGWPNVSQPGEVLTGQLALQAGDQDESYTVWAYVYTGRTCYSCAQQARDAGKKEVNVAAFSGKTVDLFVPLDDDIVDGEYKIKVRYQKSSRKTPQELTLPLYIHTAYVVNTSTQQVASLTQEQQIVVPVPKKVFSPDSPGIVVYESSASKAYDLLPSLLAFTFALLGIFLFFKRSRYT